ncbi:uncharacterized protein LOC124117053 [Haliotis rufescens]|uniref:uncharacterized protein LOC124117053 n=1 Tax=Haliotis rufescens TaxID=6454 RepID=UPI00201F0125|nr:uncharacterized protein LOC124117053 [Haliotis rufescens]
MAASLSVTVLFHNLLPPDLHPEASLSAAHCVNTCYYNRTCASVFYDRSLHLCYQSDLWFDEVVPGLISQPSVSYITFIRSDCPRNWTYHKPTGKCFFAGDDTTSSKAIAFCTSYGSPGGRLFNIYSAEEDRIPITLAIRHVFRIPFLEAHIFESLMTSRDKRINTANILSKPSVSKS